MKRNWIYLCSTSLLISLLALVLGFKSNSYSHVNNVAKDSTKPYFLFLSDVHLAAEVNISAYGKDAGTDLWAAFQSRMAAVINSPTPPAFILYTGDLPEHDAPAEKRKKDINQMLSNLQQLSALKKTPLFYLPGNNDALASDYCFFSNEHQETPLSSFEKNKLYPYQAFHVAEETVSTGAYMLSNAHLQQGYYSAVITNGLRIICLNSVLWSSQVCCKCKINCEDQVAAGTAEMSWLDEQLRSAAQAGEKVYIAMHIPPGTDDYASDQQNNTIMMWAAPPGKPDWQSQFLKKVGDYRNTIAGVFFGHTHMDEFRLLYDTSNRELINQIAISCPAVSPKFYNNPGFKLISFDPVGKLPLDFTTYYVNLNPITWQEPYSFSKLKGVRRGQPILTTLQNMKPEQRMITLNDIYTVKKRKIKYDIKGLDVR